MKNDQVRKKRVPTKEYEKLILRYLSELGFAYVDTNVGVTLGTRRLEADAVAYLDRDMTVPHMVVEMKSQLSSEPSILDSSVQQAYAIAAALGDEARFLLITDGIRHRWFERNAQSQSLEAIVNAPKAGDLAIGVAEGDAGLRRISGSEKYLQLLQIIVDTLRKEGLNFGLRMGIEINRILIAKLHDERVAAEGGLSRLRDVASSPEETAEIVRRLYSEAITDLQGMPKKEGIWSLSPKALASVLDVLRPYSISSVSREFRDLTFWRIFPGLLRKDAAHHMTPAPLAELLVKLIDPTAGESVIDPACGTGLLLLEALMHVESQTKTSSASRVGSPVNLLNVVGVEMNSEVAELASTNFALCDLPPRWIRNTNSLTRGSLEAEGIKQETFDVVLLSPPVGPIPRSYQFVSDFAIRKDHKVSFESLFIERAIHLLKIGGRMGVFVPDAFLSSPSYEWARAWLLRHTTLNAIVSLPPESFMPLGHSGKASILIVEKGNTSNRSEALIVDLQAVGYDRLGRPTRDNDLSEVLRLVSKFKRGLPLGIQDVFSHAEHKRTRAWTVNISDLDSKGLDLSKLDPRGYELIHTLLRGRYPMPKLEEVADIISGRNVKSYTEGGVDTAFLIQAGNVKESELQLGTAPHISFADYWATSRSQVKVGDVLVTTTGTYLGRAALVYRLPRVAVASSAVTIVRPTPELDPSYLEAILNSEIGREQIGRLRAAASAQPFIRRKDLGEVLIPLPPLAHQKALSNRIGEMLARARALAEQAINLEEEAKAIVVSELLGENER
jgi:type I restriction enzyme M protein